MPASRSSRWSPIVPSAAAVLVTLWVFRPLFDGRLPGNIGDARWTVAIHEHWYDVVRGDAPVRDLLSFHPVDGTLGTSDPVFLQGLVHAMARVAGFGILDAWAGAQVVAFLIGALGLAQLGRRVLATVPLQTSFVVLSCASYAVYERFEHVQLNAAFWSAWLVVAGIDLVREQPRWWTVPMLVAGPPLLAVSSWYPLALSLLVAGVFVVVALVVLPVAEVRGAVDRAAACARRQLLGWRGPVAVIAGLALWAFAAWIYLRGRGVIPATEWDEVAFFSPRLRDVVNASGRGGGIWEPVYDRYLSGTGDSERAMGFTPGLLVGLLVSTVLLVRARHRLLAATALTCLVVPALVIVDGSDRSVFRLLWAVVPGVETIRAPFRVQLLVYPLAILVVLWSMERWKQRGRWIAAIVAVAVVGLFAEMHRPPPAAWRAADLVPDELEPSLDLVRKRCEVVIVERRPDDGQLLVWVAPIDATIVSALTGVSTPQGHGRDVPIGHPGPDAYPPALVEWMAAEGYDGPACVLSARGVE